MKLVQSLSAIALIGAAVPAAHALSIKDDVVKVGVGVRLQTRAQINDASDANGDEYRVQGGVNDATNDPLDFSVRRARLYMKIGYGANWKGELAFNADNIDAASGTTSASRTAFVRYAWAGRTFKTGDVSHMVNFGLQKPQQNPSDAG